MKKIYTNVNKRKTIFNISCTSILSAMGILLMFLGDIIPFLSYPPAPFLKMEPSDTVILVVYALCGTPYAALCAFLKAFINGMVMGPVGPGILGFIGIGQITAFLTSMAYVLGLFICSKLLKLFRLGIKGRIPSYVFIVVLVAAALTFLNFLFITPTFLSGKFATCFDPRFSGQIKELNIQGSFFWIIFVIYFPFNLLKGVIVTSLYELVFNRVIFSYVKRSPFYVKLANTKKPDQPSIKRKL